MHAGSDIRKKFEEKFLHEWTKFPTRGAGESIADESRFTETDSSDGRWNTLGVWAALAVVAFTRDLL